MINPKKDKYNFIAPMGLGDLMFLCGLKRAWENINQGSIFFWIKQSQELVMKMYGISDYAIADKEDLDKKALEESAKDCPLPQNGKVYVAHPFFHADELHFRRMMDDKECSFIDWYKIFLKLPVNTKFDVPKWMPEVSDELKERALCKAGAQKLDEVVIVIVEARSVSMLPKEFWVKKVEKLRAKGLKVISNILDEKNLISGVPNIDLTLEELVALGCRVNSVYTLRSGASDLLFLAGDKLHVYYPKPLLKKFYSLNTIFDTNVVDEQVILYTIRDYNLFSLFPLLKVISYENTTYYRLFGFLPLLKSVKRKSSIKYYLFYHVTLLKIKER